MASFATSKTLKKRLLALTVVSGDEGGEVPPVDGQLPEVVPGALQCLQLAQRAQVQDFDGVLAHVQLGQILQQRKAHAFSQIFLFEKFSLPYFFFLTGRCLVLWDSVLVKEVPVPRGRFLRAGASVLCVYMCATLTFLEVSANNNASYGTFFLLKILVIGLC